MKGGNKMKKRIFKPTGKFIGNTTIETVIEQWIWSDRYGLQVVYKDGLKCQSEYTLKEFLNSEERFTEIIKKEK